MHIEYGNSWVLTKDLTGHLKHVFQHYGATGDHIIGFVYVDHEAGLSMHLHRFCTIGFLGGMKVTRDLDEARVMGLIRYDLLSRCKLEHLTLERVKSFGFPVKPDYIDIYDHSEEYRRLRTLSFIHPLRSPGFPDDIKFAMMARERQIEQVWGRLEKRLGETLYECVLLNTPHQDFGVKALDHIIVRLAQMRNGLISATFVGPLSALEQIPDINKPYKWE
jgi:hypothetical protein